MSEDYLTEEDLEALESLKDIEPEAAEAPSPRSAIPATDKDCMETVGLILAKYPKAFDNHLHWVIDMLAIFNKTGFKPTYRMLANPPKGADSITELPETLAIINKHVSTAMLAELEKHVDAWCAEHKEDPQSKIAIFETDEGGFSYSESTTTVEDAPSKDKKGWASW